MNLRKIEWGFTDWIYMAQIGTRGSLFVNVVKNLRVQ
jgi:hypothetical protein